MLNTNNSHPISSKSDQIYDHFKETSKNPSTNSTEIDHAVAESTSQILKQPHFSDAFLERTTLSSNSDKSQAIEVNKLPDHLFRKIAKEKGMTDTEIDSHISYVNSEYLSWVRENVDRTIKKYTEGNLSRSIEYLADTQTVITHFKSKVSPLDNSKGVVKGQLLGEGQFAKVKTSIINLSSQLEGHAWVADKIPKKKLNIHNNNSDGKEDATKKIIVEGTLQQLFKNCKNVCKCFRVNKNGLLLEAMKCDLSTYLSLTKLTTEQKLKMAEEIVHGVNEIHNKGYAHQDLHLENIFISLDGICKVGDFGCAQKLDEINRQPINWKIASPSIISDTTFLSNYTSKRTHDLWALGIILYEMEYGKSPSFSNTIIHQNLQAAISKYRQALNKIAHLPDSLRYQIMIWNGNSEFNIPEEFEIDKSTLAEITFEVVNCRAKVKECHDKYENALRDFYRDFSPSDAFGQLIKQLLTPNAQGTLKVIEKKISKLRSSLVNNSHPNNAISLNSYFTLLLGSYQDINSVVQNATIKECQISSSDYFVPNTPIQPSSYSSTINDNSDSSTILQTQLNVQQVLKQAVTDMEVETLKTMILDKFDVGHWKDVDGKNLLHFVSQNKQYNLEFIKFLLTIGCDLEVKDFDGKTPLCLAVENGNVKVFMTFCQLGADQNSLNIYKKPEMASKSRLQFLDANNLILGKKANIYYPKYDEWYKNQASMMEFINSTGVSKEAKEKLSLMCLQAYSKATSISPTQADKHHLQISPLFPARDRYHRTSTNDFQNDLSRSFPNSAFINYYPVNSRRFIQVLNRVFNMSRRIYTPKSIDDLQKMQTSYANNPDPQKPFLINLALIWNSECEKKWEELGLNNHEIYGFNFVNQNDTWALMILSPASDNLYNENEKFHKKIKDLIAVNGYLLSPDQTKEAWLKNVGFESILKRLRLEGTVLATKGLKFPIVCDNFDQLLNTNAFKNFKALTLLENAPPYVQILSEATCQLLEGFKDKNIDDIFKEEGLQDLLQITYHKLIDNIASAHLKRDNMSAFLTIIDQIHQEIQNILAIRSIKHGYQPHELADRVIQKLTTGENPFIPQDLEKPHVHLKSSAMRCLSSIMTSIEAEKGNPKLNIIVDQGSYYESAGLLNSIKNYQRIYIEQVGNNDPILSSMPKEKSIDAFICEIHHNVDVGSIVYNKEDIAEQLLFLYKEGLLADKCTVVIDSTMDLDESEEMRNFYHHPTINGLVKSGNLNIITYRSTQKYDMLGIDNYYGGLSISVNNPEHFKAFNRFMAHPEDQLGGLSYQGITHLQCCLNGTIDKYKRAVINNTRDLYNSIPQKMRADPNNKNLIQIAVNNDEKAVFLDIQAIGLESVPPVLTMALQYMSLQKNILFTFRASFGFANTTTIMLENDKVRLNPGLESPEQMEHYKNFFVDLQEVVDDVLSKVTCEFYEDTLVDKIKKKWGFT